MRSLWIAFVVLSIVLLPAAGVAQVVEAAPAAATSVSFGTLGAEILGWFAAVFIPVLAGFLTKLLIALAKKAGIEASQAMSDKLDGIIENGLHSGDTAVEHDLTGKLTVDVKSQAIADAVTYAQGHAAETIKSLTGSDPTDPKVIEALQARATKVLASIGPDASAPTMVPGVALLATPPQNAA